MEVYPFHHRNLFFYIITHLDLTFKEIRGILDYLLEADAFQEKKDQEPGALYEFSLEDVEYVVDVHQYEVVIYQRTEKK
jgi:hypothetical protein